MTGAFGALRGIIFDSKYIRLYIKKIISSNISNYSSMFIAAFSMPRGANSDELLETCFETQ